MVYTINFNNYTDQKLLKILQDKYKLKKEHFFINRIFSSDPIQVLNKIIKNKKIDPKLKDEKSGMGGNVNYIFSSSYIKDIPISLSNVNFIFGKKLLYKSPSYWKQGWSGGDDIESYTKFEPRKINYRKFRKQFDEDTKNYLKNFKMLPDIMSHEVLFEVPIQLKDIVCIIVRGKDKYHIFNNKIDYKTILSN